MNATFIKLTYPDGFFRDRFKINYFPKIDFANLLLTQVSLQNEKNFGKQTTDMPGLQNFSRYLMMHASEKRSENVRFRIAHTLLQTWITVKVRFELQQCWLVGWLVGWFCSTLIDWLVGFAARQPLLGYFMPKSVQQLRFPVI